MSRLQALGIRTLLLTGDNRGSAAAVAAELGIDEVRAEVLPGDKAAVLGELKAAGQVTAMVGDGLNDGPALAAADRSVLSVHGSLAAKSTPGSTNPDRVDDQLTVLEVAASAARTWSTGFRPVLDLGLD